MTLPPRRAFPPPLAVARWRGSQGGLWPARGNAQAMSPPHVGASWRGAVLLPGGSSSWLCAADAAAKVGFGVNGESHPRGSWLFQFLQQAVGPGWASPAVPWPFGSVGLRWLVQSVLPRALAGARGHRKRGQLPRGSVPVRGKRKRTASRAGTSSKGIAGGWPLAQGHVCALSALPANVPWLLDASRCTSWTPVSRSLQVPKVTKEAVP